jgi:hypothetical protein
MFAGDSGELREGVQEENKHGNGLSPFGKGGLCVTRVTWGFFQFKTSRIYMANQESC